MPVLDLGNNQNIFYERIPGDPVLPVLVFLHEGLGSTGMWKDFPEKLSALTQCPGLVYDRTGYGRSSPLKTPRTRHYLHDYGVSELPRVLDALIPERPCFFIGHSDGGSISLIFGAEQPDRVRGIVTEAAHVFVEPVTLEGIRAAEKAYAAGKFKGLEKYHGERTQAVFKAWSQTWLSDGFASWNIEHLLPAVTCPVLAIQGEEDQYGTRAQVDAIVNRVSGEAKAFMVKACGHSPHREQPDAVLAKIARFIQRESRA